MGCLNSKPPPRLEMYFDPSGILRKYDPTLPRNGADELKFVSARDSHVVKGGEEFYLISVDWLGGWVNFAKGNTSSFNEKINNIPLIDPAKEFKLRATARFKKEFRAIDKEVWNFYFERYGGGPVLVFYGMYL